MEIQIHNMIKELPTLVLLILIVWIHCYTSFTHFSSLLPVPFYLPMSLEKYQELKLTVLSHGRVGTPGVFYGVRFGHFFL